MEKKGIWPWMRCGCARRWRRRVRRWKPGKRRWAAWSCAKGKSSPGRANRREELRDPTAHAEVLAIREAARVVGDWRLTGCCMYVTLEPCPMCAGAVSQARLGRLVFGAFDKGRGCAGSVYRICEDPAFPWFTPSVGGVLEGECAQLLDGFFRRARG